MTESATPSRRQFLTGGAAFLGGATVGAAGAAAWASERSAEGESTVAAWGDEQLSFWGEHQSGIETPPSAHVTLVALDLDAGSDRAVVERLLRIWTDDAARLTSGHAALADMEPELAASPSRLTVTVGVGPSFFDRLGLQERQPAGLVEVPRLAIDQLQPKWSGGDLLLQVGGDDPVAVAHAVRLLLRDARAFAEVRWVQRGFRESRGSLPAGTTPRNLFGQVDGTVNPQPGSDDFEGVVWAGESAGWFAGGTTMVVRRIQFDLDGWDAVDRRDRELVTGRRLSDGAPLTGGDEHTPADFDATDASGLPTIPEFAHIRRARAVRPEQRFLRRGYSYDEPVAATSEISDSGLIFCSFQADIGRQFIPVQRRLAELDLLNNWTTPIGSAVFAIVPGVQDGDWLGSSLLQGS